jgi:hypothetical protein
MDNLGRLLDSLIVVAGLDGDLSTRYPCWDFAKLEVDLAADLLFGGPLSPAHQRESVLSEMPSIEARHWALTYRRPSISMGAP